jgi:Gas vesicle synthesis protein GvpO
LVREKSMADRVTPETGRIRAASAKREGAGGERRPGRVGFIARRAAEQIAGLVRRPERVISVEPADGGWRVGLEVVETARIPDTTDILGVLEVLLDANGDLVSYRRTGRYVRGDVARRCGR